MRLRTGAVGELWREDVAAGAEVGLEADLSSLWLGVESSALTLLRPPSGFTPWEFNLGAEVGWTDASPLGVRASAVIGLSALTVVPESTLRVRADNLALVPFMDLELSRPIGSGRVSVIPQIGIRLSTERSVYVDNVRSAAIGALSFKAGLELAVELLAFAPN